MQPLQHAGVQLIVHEGAHGQGTLGDDRTVDSQPSLMEFKLMTPVCVGALQKVAVIGSGAENGNAHRCVPKAGAASARQGGLEWLLSEA